ncbi:MAG: ABC transporter ATP-binding protein/permease [Clostridia bacterium]|nr:ABC transporter ATP-binding protein/permease [Clostridia bacterium]
MLNLMDIRKEYKMGDTVVHALKGVDVSFRDNEFVAILGHSGCGKTTLLNIIGGLDRYSKGDLVINGVSTKKYKDRDWDTYRNHSVGFVFQSYNLIPHQTVLSNVELALTLSGVKKSERRKRAKEALKKVGLGDQLRKKPNQMSGGQMQRVAIARSLVNNPDILLADEPTGALDTDTSVQIMEILKEVAKDRLVIMVTHNPELAEQYATRIVNLKDGLVVGDSNPVTEEEINAANEKFEKESKKKQKKPSMSFFTALSLSFNNLLTKKARTLLTSFAGSIGIIGIALILSLSSGIQAFIDNIQEDTLSSYPIVIEEEALDMTSMMVSMMSVAEEGQNREDGKVYANTVMYDMMATVSGSASSQNNLEQFKEYLDTNAATLDEYINSIQYGYDLDLLIYNSDTDEKTEKLNPSSLFEGMISDSYSEAISPSDYMLDVWQEMIPSKDGGSISPLITEQYEIVEGGGRWPENYNEVVLVVNENNEIADTALYALGLKDSEEVDDILTALSKGEEYESTAASSWDYDELLGKTFKLVLPTDLYSKNEHGVWEDISQNETLLKVAVDNSEDIKIVGIIRPRADATAASLTGAVCYTKALTEFYIDAINDSEIVKEQMADTTTDVLSGASFMESGKEYTEAEKAEMLISYIEHVSDKQKAEMYKEIISTPPEEMLTQSTEQYMMQYPDRESRIEAMLSANTGEGAVDEETARSYFEDMSDEEIENLIVSSMEKMISAQYAEQALAGIAAFSDSDLARMLDMYYEDKTESEKAEDFDKFVPEVTLDNTLHTLGSVDYDKPYSVSIYPVSFDAKQSVTDMITDYNDTVSEDDKITYTDYVALMMSSVSVIVDAVTYGLTAFVSISLVVSSIMIGVITYISVLERTKEIGVLRSMGASKRNISNIFTAETLIIGLISGLMGVGLTVLLNYPINAILDFLLTDVVITASLPMGAGIILVIISMLLTFIAGLIPSKMAAKKDPVVALRTE